MKTSRVVLTLVAFCTIAIIPVHGWTHAFLDHAEPKVGSQIHESPGVVKVWMSEDVEAKFSTLRVMDASGAEVDQKDAHVDEKDKKVLMVSVPKLPPGEYKVLWNVVAADTHRTRGDFHFTVKS